MAVAAVPARNERLSKGPSVFCAPQGGLLPRCYRRGAVTAMTQAKGFIIGKATISRFEMRARAMVPFSKRGEGGARREYFNTVPQAPSQPACNARRTS